MISGHWQLCGETIIGQVSDDKDDSPIWVELLANGESMGVARADLPEPDKCGFNFPLPAPLLEEDIELAIRVVNSVIELPQLGEEKDETGLSGEFYLDRGLTFTGWVLDPERTDYAVHIYAHDGESRVAHTVAGGRYYRPACADGHGFKLELPDTFADGQMHVIALRDEKGREIPGSPVRVCSMPENAAEWLRKQKKPEKPLLDLVCTLVEAVEERLPGTLDLYKFPTWKKAFPAPISGRSRIRLNMLRNDPLIKNQQNVEVRTGKDLLFSGGAAISLHANALAIMADAMKQYDAAVVYADSETPAGMPIFKPAWDREAFFWQDYLGPCLISGACLPAPAPSESPESRIHYILSAAKKGPVVHLPMPLSVTPMPQNDLTRDMLVDHWVAENLTGAEWKNGKLKFPMELPTVSIIIPTRDHGDLLKVCLDSLWDTLWPGVEIIIVDNGTVEDSALAVMDDAAARPNVRIIRWPGIFNYAAIHNEAVRKANGELVCFLNNDTEAITPTWLKEMAILLLGLNAGCVGAKLLWPNGLVQHGGVIIGTHQLATHVGNQWLADEPGYMNRNLYLQQYSAVTAACLLTPRNLFLELGGFDARDFPIAFNDVDYCLKVGKLGKKIYWTPHAVLMHHESASRGKDIYPANRARSEREMRAFRTRWGGYEDPFYNPNLHLSAVQDPFLGLAFPPRPRNPRIVQPC